MRYAIVLLAMGSLAVFGWGRVSNAAAAGRGPTARPETVIVHPHTGPALAADQTETVVVSGDSAFYLCGTGPDWTLVKAPEHLSAAGNRWFLERRMAFGKERGK